MDWIYFTIVLIAGSFLGNFLSNVSYSAMKKRKETAKVITPSKRRNDLIRPEINKAEVVDPVNPLDRVNLE